MNKSALKTFATNARRELLKKVEARAMKIGITEDNIKKADIESSDAIFIDGRQLSKEEKTQRDRLIDRINQIGFKRVMEEVAYTWFNRFTALRFMEVNDYLPTKVRVLSSTNAGSTEPDMIKEALSLDLELDKEYIYELKMNNNSEELFKYLIIKHCNDLNRYMPFMFETIEDYREILFPEGLLATDSFLRYMTNEIPEDNWEEIEVIGWLYQYYIAEEKDRVFKEKKKYKAEEIPFATQLFTPDWIVRYMVQNSLGRYWVESHPEHRELLNDWELYLEHNQEDFKDEIAPYVNKDLNVEDIKCFDPAMGSGHILVYAFDVFYEIYSKCGYMEREIPRLIIENNLYGLDIDDRAYQLACFSVVMKALGYNKRFLRSIEREGLTLNLAAIQESNDITDEDIAYLVGEGKGKEFESLKNFVFQFRDAKSIGSLLKVKSYDTKLLIEKLESIESTPLKDLFEVVQRNKILSVLPRLIKQTQIMSSNYTILVTNPPYMVSRSMNEPLSDYLQQHYPDSKADLFAAFMEIDHYLKENGFYACINQHSWMFLSSFEKVRKKILEGKHIENMLHLGPRAFEEIGGEVVQSTAFVLRNIYIPNLKGMYLRLIEERTSREKKEKVIEAVQKSFVTYCYLFNQNNFSKLPGSPIAYWMSENVIDHFSNSQSLGDIGVTRKGMVTADNPRFVRLWYEMDYTKFNAVAHNRDGALKSKAKWFPLQKGGEYRKWYGNHEYCINWENDGFELLNMKGNGYKVGSTNHNLNFIFKTGLTWTKITSANLSVRYSPQGFLYHDAGPFIHVDDQNTQLYVLGLLNSKVANYIIGTLNSTLNYSPGDISKIPYVESLNHENVINIVKENISLTKNDWDFSEISWEFKQQPLIKFKDDTSKIANAFENWSKFKEVQFKKLKNNEEELNRIFIDTYGLQDVLSPEEENKAVSLDKANMESDIKSFISYICGCLFGRYSLDQEGIIYAGGRFDSASYKTIQVDNDNILPILPGAYYMDEIVSKVVDFIKTTFGEDTLDTNLDFVADAIGRKKEETAKETIRRYFLNDFYKDHIQKYKQPIYWLFTSGKEKAFNCLIYIHRYDKTTLSRIRTDYLHDYQIRLDAEKKDLLNIIEGDSSAKEVSNAKKELKSLDKKIEELKAYDELLHHMADMQIEIDLDDGVKVNYEKFKGLLAPIK
ncbi:BREX-1 system adenine-specific DNA-methyltransferase PglX [Niallia sp. Sow4_A1]|uniref:BREX-1 system adenine-specific DNA-methyltransferase PglX n=1 Tax=Niallia sp. Sow4_A1 TaxID=3438793 RepID=UPI003F9E5647